MDGNPAGAIDTPALKQALALSPAFTLKLDVGNLTASNCDAVAELREYRSRVSYVLLQGSPAKRRRQPAVRRRRHADHEAC